MKEKYGISFYKKADANDTIFSVAESEVPTNIAIANHLTCSGYWTTHDQINELKKAIDGIPIQEDWGEVMGSQLDIYPTDNEVQIGYLNRRIPIGDFKMLLEEWLAFIK